MFNTVTLIPVINGKKQVQVNDARGQGPMFEIAHGAAGHEHKRGPWLWLMALPHVTAHRFDFKLGSDFETGQVSASNGGELYKVSLPIEMVEKIKEQGNVSGFVREAVLALSGFLMRETVVQAQTEMFGKPSKQVQFRGLGAMLAAEFYAGQLGIRPKSLIEAAVYWRLQKESGDV